MSTLSQMSPHRPGRGSAIPKRLDDDRVPWSTISIFLLPALLLYAAFTAYPVMRTFWNSFHHVLPRGAEFAGLANFAELGRDDIFWRSVVNTLIWAAVAPVFEVGIALLLALALYAKIPAARFFRIAWFTPVLMSYVVVGILWGWIYNNDWGALNTTLRALGLGFAARAWLGDPATALPALVLVTTWMWAGFNMVVLLAALHSLPTEVLEAADLDNCGWWGKLIHVIVPLLKATLLNLLVLSFIGKMKIFDLVWITTKGGPLWSTETVSTYVYKRAFEWNTFDLGYPSAIAAIWFFIVIFAVLLLSWLLRQREKLEF
ncbi:MAG: hypothetical protein RL682_1637 [Pseudomonadota bacterium]|jgi:ABC-type sugar transport system permease subunit